METQIQAKKDILVKTEKERQDLSQKFAKVDKEYKTLRDNHDAEVKEIFENKETLRFIKQMEHYKHEWDANSSDESRKNIATQMASTTKNWVSKKVVKKAEDEEKVWEEE